MGWLTRTGILSVAFAGTLVAAACGAGDDVPNTVKLAGTPIPTATVAPTPIPICNPPSPVSVPTNFPPEIPLSELFVPWSVETTPNLRIIGRIEDLSRDSLTLQSLLEPALLGQLKQQFEVSTDPGPNGGYMLTAPDGRTGEFLTYPIAECPGQIELFYDLYWVTG